MTQHEERGKSVHGGALFCTRGWGAYRAGRQRKADKPLPKTYADLDGVHRRGGIEPLELELGVAIGLRAAQCGAAEVFRR